MIHPTRTNLLMLKDKARSVLNGIGILKARKQALIKEFLAATAPFLRSRSDVRALYGRALDELGMALAREGRNGIASLASSAARDFTVTVAHKSIWGLRYKDVAAQDKPVREPQERGYDEYATSPHVEEGALLFEKLLEAMLRIAEYENKLKRLGAEISRTGRRIKTLEELMMPGLKKDIRRIGQYLGEREREAFYRLKRAKSVLRKREAQ